MLHEFDKSPPKIRVTVTKFEEYGVRMISPRRFDPVPRTGSHQAESYEAP